MKIGKLYTCSECHLLVFPTEETASSAAVRVSEALVAVSAIASLSMLVYFADQRSKEFNCHVSFIPAGQVFCVAEKPTGNLNKYGYCQVHVIASEVVGWINVGPEWLKIEEMNG